MTRSLIPVANLILICFLCACKTTTPVVQKTMPTVEVVAPATIQSSYKASNTKYYDLINTHLKVSFDLPRHLLFGVENITLKPHFYPQDSLVLDAVDMKIESVKKVDRLNYQIKSFYQTDTTLVVRFNSKVEAKDVLELSIKYFAFPDSIESQESDEAISNDKGLYFINTDLKDKNKPVQIWTQGETQYSSHWFPTLDAPNQRTTQTIEITVEDKFKTLSNGLLTNSIKHDNGLRTDIWTMKISHAPYLFMMAIGEFIVIHDKWKDIDVDYYVEEKYAPHAKQIFGNTPEMIYFFSKILNYNYPWPKYSQVVVRDYVSGAMENTSATLHGEWLQKDHREMIDEFEEDIISHELFHQWFGDVVTCESWANLPLNESFASYGEYLWRAYKYGRTYADNHMYEDCKSYFIEAEAKDVNLIRFDYTKPLDMFDRHTYEKGSAILHMLRYEIGDSAFFLGLNHYLTNNAYKNVEIHQLRIAFEEVCGRDLNYFFNQWFLGNGYPILNISNEYNESTKMVTLHVDQIQNSDKTFLLSPEIAIYSGTKCSRYPIHINQKSQSFSFPCSLQPDLLLFDANKSLLCRKIEKHPISEWLLMLKKGKLFLDKKEALDTLLVCNDKSAKQESIALALRDSSDYISAFAVKAISKEDMIEPVLIGLKKIMRSERSTMLRSYCMYKLQELNVDSEVSLAVKFCRDSSFLLIETGLDYLSTFNNKLADQMVEELLKSKHPRVEKIVFNYYAKSKDCARAEYLFNTFKNTDEQSIYPMVGPLASYMLDCNDLSVIKNGINEIMDRGMTTRLWYVRYAVIMGLIHIGDGLNQQLDVLDKSGKQDEQIFRDKLNLNLTIRKYIDIYKEHENHPTLKALFSGLNK